MEKKKKKRRRERERQEPLGLNTWVSGSA